MNTHQYRRLPASSRPARRHPAADEHGFVIIGVLLLSTLLMALGVFATTSARTEVQIAHNDVLYQQALAVAEGGISHAISLLKAGYEDGFDKELSTDGIGGALVALGSQVTVGGHAARFRDFGYVSGDGYYVWSADNYDDTPDDPTDDTDRRIRLISLGQVGSAARTVEAVLQGSSLFPRDFGIFGDQSSIIGGGSIIDSYDASVGPYPNGDGVSGNVGSNGNISMGGSGSTINGNAAAGGEVDGGSGTITGDITENADHVGLDPLKPCGPPYSDATGIVGGSYSPTTGALQSGSPPKDIVLAPGTYCFSSITLKSGRALAVTGATVIQVTGQADLSGGVLLNPNNPRDLLIESSYSGTGDGVKVAGGSGARAGIFAPYAHVKITGNGNFYGAVVGNSVDMSGGADFHYDQNLQDIPGTSVEVVNWRETRNP